MPPPTALLAKLDPEAELTLRRVIEGAVRTQAVHVAAALGIADVLSLEPRTIEDIAARVQAHAPTLRRILRLLVTNGVFTEHEDGRFGLSPAAEYLQTAHPRSLRPSALRAGGGSWQLAGHLLEAARTGRTPHDEVHGAPYFDRIAATGGEPGFAARMGQSSIELGMALADHPALTAARTVVDVGGGHGALLGAILRARPHLRGILLDRAEVVSQAERFLAASGVAERCEMRAGDFFDAVPAGGDVYILSWILHDWDDERALRILQACKAADARDLLIVEVLLPPRAQPVAGGSAGFDPFALDLQMLLLTGGRERTADEYGALLGRGSYAIASTLTPPSTRGTSILHAVARSYE